MSRRDVAEAPAETRNRTAKIVVVMPARQAAATLRDTFEAIPLDQVDEVILVDDFSTDETVELARKLPLELVWHPHQTGYGGNQKTCYLHALQHDADVVVMLHPDGQYEPELIPSMVEPILTGEADLVLGSRLLIPGAALAAGMPRWKYVANRFLTAIENRLMGTQLSEAHTGYRAYSRDLLLTVPFLRNSPDFSFDSELLYAGEPLRLSDPRGAGALPLLRGRLLGRFQDQCDLRSEDALGGSPARPASPWHLAVAQVPALIRAFLLARNELDHPQSALALGGGHRPQPKAQADLLQRHCCTFASPIGTSARLEERVADRIALWLGEVPAIVIQAVVVDEQPIARLQLGHRFAELVDVLVGREALLPGVARAGAPKHDPPARESRPRGRRR